VKALLGRRVGAGADVNADVLVTHARGRAGLVRAGKVLSPSFIAFVIAGPPGPAGGEAAWRGGV
jgi:hypothetical protein